MDLPANLWKHKKSVASMMNGMMDVERKRMILLSLNSPRTYRLLSILVEPSKPGNDGNVDRI